MIAIYILSLLCVVLFFVVLFYLTCYVSKPQFWPSHWEGPESLRHFCFDLYWHTFFIQNELNCSFNMTLKHFTAQSVSGSNLASYCWEIHLFFYTFCADHIHATQDIKSCKTTQDLYPDWICTIGEELSKDALAYIMTMLTTPSSIKPTSLCFTLPANCHHFTLYRTTRVILSCVLNAGGAEDPS